MPIELAQVRVIAHRGDSGTFPENTLAAFRSAVTLGAHMIELDVHLSFDNQLVVIHDETVDRTTNGSGAVAAMTAIELRRLDAGAHERIPLLTEVLDLPIAVNVEIKTPEAAAAAAELTKGRTDVLISSFNHDALDGIRRTDPSRPLAYLCDADHWQNALLRAIKGQAFSLNPPRDAVTPALISAVHSAGLRVFTYTVNDLDVASQLFAWGVDAIFTDHPARMLPLVS